MSKVPLNLKDIIDQYERFLKIDSEEYTRVKELSTLEKLHYFRYSLAKTMAFALYEDHWRVMHHGNSTSFDSIHQTVQELQEHISYERILEIRSLLSVPVCDKIIWSHIMTGVVWKGE